MRLLRRTWNNDFELVTFTTNDVPPYAILSHTWIDGEEVTYDELLTGKGKNQAGYRKIQFCGEQAARDELEYFWVDTCGIDKRSSSELQEAINSMWTWYQKADICYAYLSDVTDATSIAGGEFQFHKSRWHTRGWTLQELLAPRSVGFYSKDWTFMGTKRTLSTQLSEITRIPDDILKFRDDIEDASVAQRMSWASHRKTSRSEDIAYCLMGLFSVNLTMLYGEGGKAFLRLQEEICKEYNDNSIFAWQSLGGPQPEWYGHGLFAAHPKSFRNSGPVVREDDPVLARQTSLAMTNHGIQMKSHLLTLRSFRPNVKILVLRCSLESGYRHSENLEGKILGVLVQERYLPGLGSMYVRLRAGLLTLSAHLPHMTEMIMLAKKGLFPAENLEVIENLLACRYKLVSTPSKMDTAPLYFSLGDLESWRIVA